MEFQFGMNWSYYSHYVGDIFGAPLAIEGLMAFFLEATFVGLFFFGWDKLSKVGHLVATWAVAARLQLLGAMDPDRQWLDAEPSRAPRFNPQTMRMEVTDFYRGFVQSGCAGEVRPHGVCRLRDGLHLRARRLGLVCC